MRWGGFWERRRGRWGGEEKAIKSLIPFILVVICGVCVLFCFSECFFIFFFFFFFCCCCCCCLLGGFGGVGFDGEFALPPRKHLIPNHLFIF